MMTAFLYLGELPLLMSSKLHTSVVLLKFTSVLISSWLDSEVDVKHMHERKHFL